MEYNNRIPLVIKISDDESVMFDKFIKEYRTKHIRNSNDILNYILSENPNILKSLNSHKNASQTIATLREAVWNEFLNDEVKFNTIIMKDLHTLLDTPREIMNALVDEDFTNKNKEDLIDSIKSICGEYAGHIFPYIYKLALSNTQSRRSRAGKTFEAIIYKIYEELSYPYDSQSKAGKKLFDSVGLGKKVDSILPGIESFKQRRNKTIIGTMKTSLRERWQEVAEEIERTNIPEIHLLTCDKDISTSKATEMANHNITIVTYGWIAQSAELKDKKNIISFEDYLFSEIPAILKYWNE